MCDHGRLVACFEILLGSSPPTPLPRCPSLFACHSCWPLKYRVADKAPSTPEERADDAHSDANPPHRRAKHFEGARLDRLTVISGSTGRSGARSSWLSDFSRRYIVLDRSLLPVVTYRAEPRWSVPSSMRCRGYPGRCCSGLQQTRGPQPAALMAVLVSAPIRSQA